LPLYLNFSCCFPKHFESLCTRLTAFFILPVSALREKKTKVVVQLKQLQSETEPIVKMLEDLETTRYSRCSPSGKAFGFNQEYYCFVCRSLPHFNKCPMLCIPKVPSTDRNAPNFLQCKLTSEILMGVITFIPPHSRYLSAVQIMCPHILRYLTTAVITNKDVIQREPYTYKDPITEFGECLECELALVSNFLVACHKDFIENAHLFISETFCRIHQCIGLSLVAQYKLNMTPEGAERWIVNLIHNARLDAKIDSKLGHVVKGNSAISPYQQVIENTKSLSFRSQMLALNTEKQQTPNWAGQETAF
uniref:PCI domain-containing protein n=1 Tax=Monopterus albus TaxID=43700 RepID=A0A3Q3ITZ9_MONAL